MRLALRIREYTRYATPRSHLPLWPEESSFRSVITVRSFRVGCSPGPAKAGHYQERGCWVRLKPDTTDKRDVSPVCRSVQIFMAS
jgi:hypothetical protein